MRTCRRCGRTDEPVPAIEPYIYWTNDSLCHPCAVARVVVPEEQLTGDVGDPIGLAVQAHEQQRRDAEQREFERLALARQAEKLRDPDDWGALFSRWPDGPDADVAGPDGPAPLG